MYCGGLSAPPVLVSTKKAPRELRDLICLKYAEYSLNYSVIITPVQRLALGVSAGLSVAGPGRIPAEGFQGLQRGQVHDTIRKHD
jgi:hypothetical protein